MEYISWYKLWPSELCHFLSLWDVHCVDYCFSLLLGLLHLLQHLQQYTQIVMCLTFTNIRFSLDFFSPYMFLSFSLTLLFLRALASASLLIGRALISFHFCLYSSTISRVTGMGFFLFFLSSAKNHTGISPVSCELVNLKESVNDEH